MKGLDRSAAATTDAAATKMTVLATGTKTLTI
jgi:hypothetical protein